MEMVYIERGKKMIDYAVLSSPGERKLNEDCFSTIQNGNSYVFIVADGLGAHGLGNVASEGACDIISENIFKMGLEESVIKAQDVLLDEQTKNGLHGKMKTTLTLINIQNNQFEQLHLGDSRIYHFSRFRLLSQTKDHSVCQKLVDAGLIKQEEVRHHPDRNKLLNVLGVEWTEREPYKISSGILHKSFEAILMCTDGFWEWIEEKEMKQCLRKSKTAEEWLEKMEAIILQRGVGHHMDNYTAIGIIYKE